MERLPRRRSARSFFPSEESKSPSSSDKTDSISEEDEESSSEKVKVIKKKNNINNNNIIINNDNNNNIINNDNILKNSEDLTKCYICLNKSLDPVICRFCGNMACKKCFKKWLKNENKKCGCCRKELKEDDLISPPIIKNISNYLNKFQEELNHEICRIHKEKILFFCMNCLKKYCGKCLFFGSEEAKIHQGHNIIDYSLLKNSEYNDIINKLETSKDNKDKIEEEIVKNESYKEEIKNIFDNSKIALENFQKEIEKKLKEKLNTVSKYSEELKQAKVDLEKNNNEILNNLSKLEKIDNKIENFDANNSKEELELILNKINILERQSIFLRNEEIKIDFKLNYFPIIKNYNELINSKYEIIVINEPILIKMKLEEVEGKEEQSILKIIVPKKNKNSFFLFFSLKLNNKTYHFELKENEDKKKNSNNPFYTLEEIKNKKEKEGYITTIPKSELSKTDNVFYFSNYIFTID